MKKLFALLLAVVMLLGLVACASTPETPAANDAPAVDAPASGVLTEEEAAAARDAGTLTADPTAGYDHSDSTDTWYYSNYPNYKDFKADGVVKVAFVCKFSGAWFTPKAESLGETVKGAGYEYLYIDANSGWHVYNNMEQILDKKMWTDNHPFVQSDAHYEKHMLPATDDILSRAVNISVGVVDKGLGSGTGININSTEDEIKAVGENIRQIVLSL